jgi:hypothetical protein
MGQIEPVVRLDLLLSLSKSRAHRYLRAVESGYHDNPYHNAAHAAHVVQVRAMRIYLVTNSLTATLQSPTSLPQIAMKLRGCMRCCVAVE